MEIRDLRDRGPNEGNKRRSQQCDDFSQLLSIESTECTRRELTQRGISRKSVVIHEKEESERIPERYSHSPSSDLRKSGHSRQLSWELVNYPRYRRTGAQHILRSISNLSGEIGWDGSYVGAQRILTKFFSSSERPRKPCTLWHLSSVCYSSRET